MKKFLVIGVFLSAVLGGAGLVVLVPNPLGANIMKEAKAMGYIAYTPEEATSLAYERCSTCHTEDKMLKYCTRCGPPFIVVTHTMRKYIDLSNAQNSELDIEQFTDSEIVAITQAWNALIGNWENDWPKKDIRKLLDGDAALIRLLDTPVKNRPIEAALEGKSAPGVYQRYGIGTGDRPS